MMSNPSRIQTWIVDGQLLTNRPKAFAKNFELPKAAPVDGLTRVSQKFGKMKPRTAARDNNSDHSE